MGIKDTTYASLFDKKDLPYLYRLAEEVRATHNQYLVTEFNTTLEKKWNDHNPILEIGNKDIEILQVSKADDLVVTAGINWLIDQILGTTVIRWQYLVSGTGTTAPTISDIGVTGLTTVDMSLSGWREYAGSSLRFAAIFGESSAQGIVTECDIAHNGPPVTILNRNVFSNNSITHTVNVTGYVISSIVEFVPIM